MERIVQNKTVKFCPKCTINKSNSEFNIDTTKSDGLQSQCKACRQKYYKSYFQKTKNLTREHRKYYMREYEFRRKKSDINFKLVKQCRIRLNMALKNRQKSGSAVRDLGCSIEQLKQHLESKFQPGMTWDNWSRDGWHIDHIIPLCYVDLTDREQFLKACHYTNLQPLWAKDNYRKYKKKKLERKDK